MGIFRSRSRVRRSGLLAMALASFLGAASPRAAATSPTAPRPTTIVPLPGPRAVPIVPQAQNSSRERSGLAEDQALLQRQLARLRQTMDILASRFEAEGRTHAAKLLREGLAHLGDRAGEQGAKTLDELMGGAKSSLDSGQTMQAVEVQESVVKSLEKLYAILTDRQGLDDLERSLDDLRKIKTELGALADREKTLRDRTSELERAAASPQQKDLQEGIQKAIAAQRSLLARTETRARESGEMEMESIARELEALAARQATDTAVLESWKPEDRSSLEAAVPATAESQEHASTAQRLAQAAKELRDAAAAARDAKSDLAAGQHALETSAEREERRERAAAEANDKRSAADTLPSKSLRAGARALSEASPTPESRAGAARAIEEQAEALEKAAEAELAAARENREAARAALDRLAQGQTAAAETAARARDALDSASKSESGAKKPASSTAAASPGGDPKSPAESRPSSGTAAKPIEERAEDARRAAAEAGRALSAGLEDQATLPQAVGASQKRASEESARLERALEAHPEGNSAPGSQARQELEAASASQKSASQSASEGRSSESASAARSAQEHLAAAKEALQRARDEAASGASASEKDAQPGAAEEKALAKEQEDLAAELEALEKKAEAADATATSPSSSSPSAAKPSGADPSGAKPSSSDPSGAKPSGSDPSGAHPPESNPSSGQPPSGAKPSGAKPSESASPSAPPNPGAKDSQAAPSKGAKSDLAAAKEAMKSAAKSLASRSPTAASKAQREALASLQKAGEKGQEGAPITKPEDRAQAEQLAQEQERIRQEILELAKRNQKRDASKPAPGLPKAGSSAAKAKASLDEGELGEAEQKEEDAEKQMREALGKLSEEEEQYQKLRAEELLFKVAEQVRAVQEGHQDQMRETKEIDATRKSGDPATHTQRLRLRKIAKAEEGLAARAAEMEKAIRAEESLVFAEILDQVDRDLLHVSKDLGEEGGFQSGDRVQALQQDVDQALAWLRQALQAEKERRRQEEGQSGSGGQSPSSPGRNRLVADAAELKLLRQLEVENIDNLEKFKAAHPDLGEAAANDPMLLEDLSRLANRHQRTSDLFEKFRKRLGLPDPTSQEP